MKRHASTWMVRQRATILPLITVALAMIASGLHAEPTADRVYGQPTFFTQLPLNAAVPLAARIYKPLGIAVTSEGVYISDEPMDRVVFFPHGRTVATRAYGQIDFESDLQNAHGINVESLAMPQNIDASAAGLVVADFRNCRAVFFPPGSMAATRIFSQPNGSATIPTGSADPLRSIKYPFGATIDEAGGAYIVDSMANRVVYYPPGQNIGTRIYERTGVGTAQYLLSPNGAAVDDSGLYIADTMNNRVLFFPAGSAVATRVYGQPNFDTTTANANGISATSLFYPADVAVDGEGVYISDNGNRRVLYYPGESTTATIAYGQKDLVSAESGVSATRMLSPWGVAADRYAVYVSDMYGARALRFPKNETVPTHLAFSVQPVGGPVGGTLPGQPVVNVLRADGSLASDYNGPVSLEVAPGSNASYARVTGQASVNAVSGVATFTDVRVDRSGTLRLEASAGTLGVAESDAIVITIPTSSVPGDYDGDGAMTIGDTVIALRALFGLGTLPSQ